MTQALTVCAELRAAKGKGDALATLLVEQMAAVRASEPGCTAYLAHRSTTDPELFFFYETYVDDAAFEVHRASPVLAKFRERRERDALTEGGAKVTLYREVTGT
jgi:quinol monooxygenase YgiN